MLTEFDFDLSEMKSMYDDAYNQSTGGRSNVIAKTIEQILSPYVLIGALFKGAHLSPICTLVSLISAANDLLDTLHHDDKVECSDLYKQTVELMQKNNYRKVRLEGYFSERSVVIDGETVTVNLINGCPRVTGFLTSNGRWMLAE